MREFATTCGDMPVFEAWHPDRGLALMPGSGFPRLRRQAVIADRGAVVGR